MNTMICVEESLFYGRDSRGKNIILPAYVPLKVVERGEVFTVVKRCGKGYRRLYDVRNEKLVELDLSQYLGRKLLPKR